MEAIEDQEVVLQSGESGTEGEDRRILSSPVFVVGALRSGTTLLRLLLDHHSEINIFGEFEAAVSQIEDFEWPDMNQYHDFLVSDRQTDVYKFRIDKSLGYVELVKSLFRQMVDRTSKPIVGAAIHSRIDMLPVIWPEARYVHLLRDPRDVASSCIGMGWVGNVYYGADYWIDVERRWERVLEQVGPHQHITVCYEDLVSDPRKVLGDICRFLGLEFQEQMLAIEGDTSYSAPDPRLASQWQRRLTSDQARLVEWKCGALLNARGYQGGAGDWPGPGVLERILLLLQNRALRVQFNIGRFGFVNWVSWIFAKRFGPKPFYLSVQGRINAIQKANLK